MKHYLEMSLLEVRLLHQCLALACAGEELGFVSSAPQRYLAHWQQCATLLRKMVAEENQLSTLNIKLGALALAMLEEQEAATCPRR